MHDTTFKSGQTHDFRCSPAEGNMLKHLADNIDKERLLVLHRRVRSRFDQVVRVLGEEDLDSGGRLGRRKRRDNGLTLLRTILRGQEEAISTILAD